MNIQTLTQTFIGLSIALVFALPLSGQTKEAAVYSFDNYPAPIYRGPKVNIKYVKHSIADWFRPVITKQYKVKEVNFAGHYIVTFWQSGGQMRALVDVLTGKVYTLPVALYTDIDTATKRCGSLYYPNSRLLQSISCEPSYNSNGYIEKVTDVLHWYLWNEKTKTLKELPVF